MIEDKPNKLDTLIKCLPDAPYKAALVSEIESLRAELAEVKANYLSACQTVAKMHEAAVGATIGPIRGVVEDVDDLRAERNAAVAALEQLKQWSEAYPLAVFPEPDFKKAHLVLTAHGMTLDAISASNMRHVITQARKIIDAAIAKGEAP